MAITKSYGVTNTDQSQHTLKLAQLKLVDNYSLKVDEPGEVQLVNRTTPVDQEEIITFQASTVKSIPTKLNLAHPSAVTTNLMYGVRGDFTLRLTSDIDDTFVQDLPVVVNLSIKHPRTANIAGSEVWVAVMRTLSALMKEDGNLRFDDLMHSALDPTEN